jgi:hypothetical protein
MIPNSIAQICVCLKEEFDPFLKMILPKLLSDTQKDIDFKVIDSDKVDDNEEVPRDDNKGLYVDSESGRKFVSINSNALEVKLNSLTVLK